MVYENPLVNVQFVHQSIRVPCIYYAFNTLIIYFDIFRLLKSTVISSSCVYDSPFLILARSRISQRVKFPKNHTAISNHIFASTKLAASARSTAEFAIVADKPFLPTYATVFIALYFTCTSHMLQRLSNAYSTVHFSSIFLALSRYHRHIHESKNINIPREHVGFTHVCVCVCVERVYVRGRCHGSIIRHVSNFRLSELFRPTFRSVRVDKNLPLCQAAMR